MAEIPEQLRHLLDRQGLEPVSALTIAESRTALRAALPTRAHARRFFDAACARLGERGLLDDTHAPRSLALHVRDGELLVGLPLITLLRGDVPGQVRMEIRTSGVPEGPTPAERRAPDIAPRGPEMVRGSVRIEEGLASFAVEYDERGLLKEGTEAGGDLFTWSYFAKTSPYLLDPLARPPTVRPTSVQCAALSASGSPESLAEHLSLDEAAARTAFRVHRPARVPRAISEIMDVGAGHLGNALADGTVPAEARWAAADGVEGRVIAWGPSVEATLEHFRAEAFRKKPRVHEPTPAEPPPPLPPHEPGPERDDRVHLGSFQISIEGPPLPFPWPRLVPANVPALLLPLPPLPAVPEVLARAGFTRVVRALGRRGQIGHVFVRDEPGGWTGIGEHVVDVVGDRLDTLTDELDAVDAEQAEDLRDFFRPGDEKLTATRHYYSVWDDERRTPRRPRSVSLLRSGALSPGLDGDTAPWRVVRERR